MLLQYAARSATSDAHCLELNTIMRRLATLLWLLAVLLAAPATAAKLDEALARLLDDKIGRAHV